MPSFRRGEVVLEYTERGSGFPVLLFAPGGMRSSIPFWDKAPWNPLVELADQFRVIGMDQRNAGGSSAPVYPGDGWHIYAADHVALLDHLGIERCHVLGGCIGGAYALGLIQAAPQRVAAAVLQQPIGSDGANRPAFYELFDGWAREVAARQPDVGEETWRAFRSAMYDGHFTFNVDRDFVRGCTSPLLVLMGNDLYHPQVTSREIAALAPRAELVENWKEPGVVGETVKRVRRFLEANTPR